MANRKTEDQKPDVVKSSYEEAMKRVDESNYDGEPFDAECFTDFPDSAITTGMEVTCQYLREDDGFSVVVDGTLCVPEEVFLEYFVPLNPDGEDVNADENEEDDQEDDQTEFIPDIPEGLSASEIFEHLLLQTERPGIESLIDWCRSSDYYSSPASTKYHGSYDGGLIDHCLTVYDNLYNVYQFTKQLYPGVPEIPIDSIIIAALLHDICKVNTYVHGTRNVKNEETGQWEKIDVYNRSPMFSMGHGGKSVFIAQQFIQLTPQEAQAIYWHMGGFDLSNYNTANELTQSFEENLLAFLLHQADMLAMYVTENQNYQED